MSDASQLTILGPAPLPRWLDVVVAAVRFPVLLLPFSGNGTKKALVGQYNERTDAVLVIVAGKLT